jgi:hypothetical protein
MHAARTNQVKGRVISTPKGRQRSLCVSLLRGLITGDRLTFTFYGLFKAAGDWPMVTGSYCTKEIPHSNKGRMEKCTGR